MSPPVDGVTMPRAVIAHSEIAARLPASVAEFASAVELCDWRREPVTLICPHSLLDVAPWSGR